MQGRCCCTQALGITARVRWPPYAELLRVRCVHSGNHAQQGKPIETRGHDMGDIENKAEELKGAAKQHIGDATDNEDLQAEGAAEKATAEVKQGGENVKDAVKDTFDR